MKSIWSLFIGISMRYNFNSQQSIYIVRYFLSIVIQIWFQSKKPYIAILPIPRSIFSRWTLPPIFGSNLPHHTRSGNYVRFGSYVPASECSDGGKWDLTGTVSFKSLTYGALAHMCHDLCSRVGVWNAFKFGSVKSGVFNHFHWRSNI